MSATHPLSAGNDSGTMLVPMSPADAADLRGRLVLEYECAYTTGWHSSQAEARAAAGEVVASLFDDGVSDLSFFAIRSGGQDIGWLLADLTPLPPAAAGFVHFVWINPESRRRGHAKNALRALERMAMSGGLDHLRLHVFAGSQAARRLYESCGYTVAGFNLKKGLVP